MNKERLEIEKKKALISTYKSIIRKNDEKIARLQGESKLLRKKMKRFLRKIEREENK